MNPPTTALPLTTAPDIVLPSDLAAGTIRVTHYKDHFSGRLMDPSQPFSPDMITLYRRLAVVNRDRDGIRLLCGDRADPTKHYLVLTEGVHSSGSTGQLQTNSYFQVFLSYQSCDTPADDLIFVSAGGSEVGARDLYHQYRSVIRSIDQALSDDRYDQLKSSYNACADLIQNDYYRDRKAKFAGALVAQPISCFSVPVDGVELNIYPAAWAYLLEDSSPLLQPTVSEEASRVGCAKFQFPEECTQLSNWQLLSSFLQALGDGQLLKVEQLARELSHNSTTAVVELRGLWTFCRYFNIRYCDQYLEQLVASDLWSAAAKRRQQRTLVAKYRLSTN
jgi:hypothetical protein